MHLILIHHTHGGTVRVSPRLLSAAWRHCYVRSTQLSHGPNSTALCQLQPSLWIPSTPDWKGKLGHGMINILAATQGLTRATCGDADHSGAIDISDVVFLIAYIFGGGAAPYSTTMADADCSGSINISDAVTLISYIFSEGHSLQ